MQSSTFANVDRDVGPIGTGAAVSEQQSYTHGIERLLAVTQELSLAHDVPTIARIVRNAARQLTGADGASFIVLEGAQCFYADAEAVEPFWKGRRIPVTECIGGWVMQNRRAVAIEDIYADDRIAADTYRATFVKSLAMVPAQGDRALAAVGSYWAKQHVPTNVEMTLLQALADSAANALDNAQRIYDLETRLRDCSAALEAARNVETGALEHAALLLQTEQGLRGSEEQLRQVQKMRAVGELAAGVAHDFNNLLSVVLSYGSLINSGLKPDDPLRDDVTEIRRAGERAAGLTQQLLAFSQQQVLAPRTLNINDLVSGLARQLPKLLGEQIRAELRLSAEALPVSADPKQLEQALLGLIANARDAMPTGGLLNVITETLVLRDDDAARGLTEGSYVSISVADTGAGMTAETRERVFEPFFTTKVKGKGTGLGLATVYGIVKQSGGQIGVKSEPGKGTTFTIHLPKRVDSFAPLARDSQAAGRRGGTETVLLVEDDDQVRKVTSSVLRRNGYTVIEVSGPGEALLAGEQHRKIDLLVTDVVMPQMSGVELARRFAVSYPNIKVLCTSGYPHGGLDANVPFLQKPITPPALLEKVREVLDGTAERGRPS